MSSLAYAALWLFVFSVPWESLVRINAANVVTRATGVLAVGVTVLAVVTAGRIRRWHPFHLASMGFLLWAAGTLFVFHSGDRLPHKFWTYVQLFAVLWMVWEAAPSFRRQYGLLTAYMFGAYVTALGTIIVFRRDATMRRFSAAGADPNDFAMILALGLPIAWYLGMTYRRPLMRWICRAYLPVGLLAIALTGSRGGMLTAMVAMLIVPLTMMRLSAGRRAAAISVLVVAGLVAIAYVPERIVDRLATTGLEVEDLSLGGRFKIWKAGIYAFGAKPIAGYGTSGFKTAVTPVLGGASQVAHNSFLSVLVEQGLVGFALYMSMFVIVLMALLELPTIERRFTMVLLGTLCAAMLPLTWEDRKPVWIVLAMLLGFSQAYVAEYGGIAGQRQVSRPAPLPEPRRPPRPLEPAAASFRDRHRDRPA